MITQNDLITFMKEETRALQAEYERIQTRVLEDPGTAGDQGEENWAQIFRGWLPSNYHIVTKGRILGTDGSSSPQVDVIILHPFYPRNLLNKKYYLAAGVAAVFECKITLRRQHIVEAIKSSIALKKLTQPVLGNYVTELYSPIIYGIIAHSHEWKKAESNPKVNITNALAEADSEYVNHPFQQLDMICVSDLAFWSTIKRPVDVHYLNKGPNTGYALYDNYYVSSPNSEMKFTAIGVFLAKLMKRLAFFDGSIKEFSKYFEQVLGTSSGFNPRHWPREILSLQARENLPPMTPQVVNELLWYD